MKKNCVRTDMERDLDKSVPAVQGKENKTWWTKKKKKEESGKKSIRLRLTLLRCLRDAENDARTDGEREREEDQEDEVEFARQ